MIVCVLSILALMVVLCVVLNGRIGTRNIYMRFPTKMPKILKSIQNNAEFVSGTKSQSIRRVRLFYRFA